MYIHMCEEAASLNEFPSFIQVLNKTVTAKLLIFNKPFNQKWQEEDLRIENLNKRCGRDKVARKENRKLIADREECN